jgi:hypothetical protein
MRFLRPVVLSCAVAVGAASFLAAAPDALAKKKAEKLLCKFGGRKLKCNVKESLTGSYSSLTHGLILAGISRSGSGLKTRVGQFTLTGQAPVDVLAATFPVTVTGASATYSLGGVAGAQGWAGEQTITIVLTGYDATARRLTGTFEGTMAPGENTPAGAVTVTSGKLSLNVIVDGQ